MGLFDNLPTEDELDDNGWLERTVKKCTKFGDCPKTEYCIGYSTMCKDYTTENKPKEQKENYPIH